jgi:hypothetical protein
MRNQNTIYRTPKKSNKKKIILTDLLSTSMAIEGNPNTKKNYSRRKGKV